MSDAVLEFTGERFTPECVREIWYEHLHRYAFACRFAGGARVLDAACGEGYGSALLAERAASVVGVDLAADAVEHARGRYGSEPRLRFECADVTALDHLPDHSFDLIVSFETLEHVEAQERMLDGFRRLLTPRGLLLISTPDRLNYSERSGFHNEFHLRELYRDEFEAMLASRFAARRLWAQKLLFQSLLWSPDAAAGGSVAAGCVAGGRLQHRLDYPPLYWLALCGQDPTALPTAPALHLFGDAEESVYRHYEHEIRTNMAAGRRIQELEHELERLRAQLAAATQ